MKRSVALIMAALLAMSVLGGCAEKEAAGTPISGALQQLKVEDYVTVGDYSNLSIEVEPKIEVTEDQIEELYVAVYTENVQLTDRAVKDGDTVVIDFEGKKDGVAFEGGTSTDYPLTIGSGSFIEGFEEGLVGVMPGDTVDLNLTFPEDYENSEELKGAAVVFTVTVKYIMPGADEMKDEAVPSLEIKDVSTLADLRAYVTEYLEESAQQQYDANVQSAILEQLLASSTFNELPEAYVSTYDAAVNAQLESYATQYGLDMETFATYFLGTSIEEYVAEVSNTQAQQEVLLQAIANKEGIVLTQEDIQAEMEREMEKYGIETKEDLLGVYTEEQYANFYMCKEVMELLVSKTTITEVEATDTEVTGE